MKPGPLALVVLSAVLLALPAAGHDPSKEVEALQVQLRAEQERVAAKEREVRSWKTKVDMAEMTAQRHKNMLQEKTRQFDGLRDNFSRLADRLDQSLGRNEQLLQRSEAELPLVIAALDHTSADVRAKAAKAVGARGKAAQAAEARLEELRGDPNPAVSVAATEALKRIQGH